MPKTNELGQIVGKCGSCDVHLSNNTLKGFREQFTDNQAVELQDSICNLYKGGSCTGEVSYNF